MKSQGAAHQIQILALGVLLIGGTSCALYDPRNDKKATVKECVTPTDQTGTYSGRWQVTPIPLGFHQGDFQSDEVSSIIASADTWNNFFNASKSKKTIDYGSTDTPKVSAASNPTQLGALCAQGIVQGSSFSGSVIVYKMGRWPSSYPANAMALTSFCTLPVKPYPTMYMAVMEVNYQNFFVSGQKVPDLQSIMAHELGHLHGLNHSCEAATKTGTPNCNDPNLNPDYGIALMYPVFTFDTSGAGQQKRDLGTNDQGRANCLY